MPLPDQTAMLCRAIRKEGQSEARDILSKARSEAERILEQARETTARNLERQLALNRQKAYQEARRIIDGAELKAKQQVMAARQEILEELFREGRKRLLALRQTHDYTNILKLLTLRAVAALPTDDCWVQVRREDMAVFSMETLLELSRESGKNVMLLDEPADISGGCLAFSKDRRIFVDFYFDVLLERSEPFLRKILSQEIVTSENG